MEIEIFSSKSQPYGLLSNNAIIPMTINGNKWLSVTEYVYVNLFDTKEYMEKMRKLYARNPFEAAVNLQNERDNYIYLEAIIYGTRIRFSQNKDLMKKLLATRGRPLRVIFGNENESRQLSILFNKLRYDNFSKFFYDYKYGPVSFQRVNDVVVSVAKKLMDNPDMKSKPFSELERECFKEDLNATPRRDLVSLLHNLDEIVPVLKIKFKNKIYAKKIIKFKEYLLDETLNYILENHYPQLSRDSYHLAKYQQKQKEKDNISRYEDKLYDLYQNNGLPLELLNKLEWTVSIPTGNEVTSERINDLSENNTYLNKTDEIIIENNHEFLPQYPDSIKIGEKTYRSVMAYAYSILIDKLGDKQMEMNVNALDVSELPSKYLFHRNEKLWENLTQNNELATQIKFESHPSLVSLLLATENLKLIWADRTDQVLGISPPLYHNRCGQFLEFLRSKFKEPKITLEYPLDSIVISSWFKSRVEDYANTLTLFKNKNIQDLKLIYHVVPYPLKIIRVTKVLKDIMNNGGLNDSDQKIVIPLLGTELENIFQTNQLNYTVRSMVNSYNLSNPIKRQLAEENLSKIYDRVRINLRSNVNRMSFIGIILSNQPVVELKQEQWWRINYWSSFYVDDTILRTIKE